MESSRFLNVFLCHSSQDKPVVRKLYQRLLKYKNLEPWLDEKKILPGQDWDLEIKRAMRASDAIIICLSNNSVTKEGYVQKELKLALDIASEKPEGVIFLIPLLLESCKVPDSLASRQWVNYYDDLDNNHKLLVKALQKRADNLGLNLTKYEYYDPYPETREPKDLYQFVKIQEDENITYPYWMAKYPVTNVQYERYITSADFSNDLYWQEFPVFDRHSQYLGAWTADTNSNYHNYFKEKPSYWDRNGFGNKRKHVPVVGVNWFGANAYCKWLTKHWYELPEGQQFGKEPKLIRLPTEKEWIKAAGGDKPKNRFPWDKKGRATRSLNEIQRYANVGKGFYSTTAVDKFPNGASPYGVVDMAGNAREWLANQSNDNISWQDSTKRLWFIIRGGWFKGSIKLANLSGYESFSAASGYFLVGFRIVVT
jgi:formylglycine-generating enzyme required for sulfatase activity